MSESTKTTESSSNYNKVTSTSLPAKSTSLSATSKRLRLVTWNIYGLGNKDTLARTSAACDTLESLFPDVIFLQEVIPKTLHFIQERLGSLYQLVPGGQQNAYFTLTLVKRSPDINILQTKIHSFPKTKMARNLLIVKTACYGVKVTFMNTHLESRMQDRPERRNQLSQCMAEMKAQGPEMVAIFGGDTNLDTYDVQEGDIPAGIVDVFGGACGKRVEQKSPMIPQSTRTFPASLRRKKASSGSHPMCGRQLG
eukprot:XP_011672654.1 PREDICTED: tyrosyl-DNA phosphodiesterase 2-like [Strongylocentrotus purpuratus]